MRSMDNSMGLRSTPTAPSTTLGRCVRRGCATGCKRCGTSQHPTRHSIPGLPTSAPGSELSRPHDAVTTALTPATNAHLRRGLADVCAVAGIEPQHPHLLKYTINAVYRVGACVVRLARGPLAEARAERVVRVADEFARRGLPVVCLVRGVDQPIRANGWVATAWTHVPTTGERPQPVQLAGPLRAIHAIDDLRIELPGWAPITKARQRLETVRQLPDHEAELTRTWARSRLDRSLEDVLVFLHNWCDLDGVGIGPREWDLTPIAHGAQRFGRTPADHHAFAAAYGFDVTEWDGWPVLRDVRELQLVTSVVDNIGGRPDVADQLALRLHSILAGDRTITWTRYH